MQDRTSGNTLRSVRRLVGKPLRNVQFVRDAIRLVRPPRPDTAWLTVLRAAQEEIARCAPTPWYVAENHGTNEDGTEYHYPPYRDAEEYYWLPLARWIEEDVRWVPFRRCLDVGSGYGTLSLFTRLLCGGENYLLDFMDLYMSRDLVARREFVFRVCNVELDDLPFAGPFDAIIFSEVLEHLNFHPVPTLRKIAGALAPWGKLYLSTPDAQAHGRVTAYYPSLAAIPPPRRGQRIYDDHIYVYDESELRSVLDAAGLALERFDYAPGWGGQRHLNAVCVRKPRGRARAALVRALGRRQPPR